MTGHLSTAIATPLLAVNNVSWQQNQKRILTDLNFQVGQGEMLGIIGPNGAGKTSLLRCMAGQITDHQGAITLRDKPLGGYSVQQLAQHIAVVSQHHQAIFSLTVFDVVRMGLLPHKNLFAFDSRQDHQKMIAAVDQVGLADYLHKPFNQLSGGEQQRVLIARALVQGAQLLLLDEPTNHLDVYYQHQILHLIKQLNITVIVTIHDLNLAAEHCQRLLLLKDGQLMIDGSPDEVLQPPLLTEVFGLPCIRDINPYSHCPRVSFYLANGQTRAKVSHE